MDVRFAGTERPASWLVPEIVPQLNSPTAKRTGVMGLPLPLATGLSWVGPPSNLGGGMRALCPSINVSHFV